MLGGFAGLCEIPLAPSISARSGLRSALRGDVSLWQGRHRLAMIPRVPTGPGTAVKDSPRRTGYGRLEIIFREILQYRADIAKSAVCHHMREKQFHVP